MKYCIVMSGRRCECVEGRERTIQRIKAMVGETIVDIRKVYKSGVMDSVADTPAWCGYIGKEGADDRAE